MFEITSLSNAKIKAWAKYKEKKHRDDDQCFIVEGEHLIQEAYAAKVLQCIIVLKGREIPDLPDVEVYVVSDEILRKLTSLVSKETLLGICRYQSMEVLQAQRYVLLDDVQDPGNVGTILRSAYAFGYDGIVLSMGCADIYNEKVIRATQGALFHMQIVRAPLASEICKLKQKGFHIVATSLHEATMLRDTTVVDNVALIFGNEGQGVSQDILAMSDERIQIEMDTFESLNVAVAAGICMYRYRNP